jgi:hypothetical protein
MAPSSAPQRSNAIDKTPRQLSSPLVEASIAPVSPHKLHKHTTINGGLVFYICVFPAFICISFCFDLLCLICLITLFRFVDVDVLMKLSSLC